MPRTSDNTIVYKAVPIEGSDRLPAPMQRRGDVILREAMTVAAGAELVRVVIARVVEVATGIVVDLVVHTAVGIKRGQAMYELYVGLAKDRCIEIAEVQIRDPQLRRQVVDAIRNV